MKTVQKLQWLNSRASPSENLVEFSKRRKQQNVVVPSDSNRTKTTVSVVAAGLQQHKKYPLRMQILSNYSQAYSDLWLVRTLFLFFLPFLSSFFSSNNSHQMHNECFGGNNGCFIIL